eukprot:scaffold22387_cov78-Skeletonema_dohrnii-CCMP3373.AAC.1
MKIAVRTKPAKVPGQQWVNNATVVHVDRALGRINDNGRDNTAMAVHEETVLLFDDRAFSEYVEVEVLGSSSIHSQDRTKYLLQVSRHGVHCNCDWAWQGNTCKHCLLVLHTRADVPVESLRDTGKCKEYLNRFINKRCEAEGMTPITAYWS